MSFSQDLTPLIQEKNSDTLFCFTIEQSKFIASLLEEGKFNKSLLKSNYTLNAQLTHIIEVKDSIIDIKDIQIEKKDLIIQNEQKINSLTEENLEITEKQLKKKKTQNVFLTIGLAIVSIVAIVK